MRILITGGTGLIGTQLVQALVMHSHQVTVLSRSPQKYTVYFVKRLNAGQPLAIEKISTNLMQSSTLPVNPSQKNAGRPHKNKSSVKVAGK